MTSVDFDLLRRHLAEAASRAFSEVRTARPNEKFYAFALYTVDDAIGVRPSASSEESYSRLRNAYARNASFTKADLIGNYRWSPYHWAYDCGAGNFFFAIDDLFSDRGQLRHDDRAPDELVQVKAGVLAAMVLALADLDAEGFFGLGEARLAVTVFCSVFASDCTSWLEADSARRLNAPEQFDRFAAERVAYIAERPDELSPVGNVVYSAYLARVEGACGRP